MTTGQGLKQHKSAVSRFWSRKLRSQHWRPCFLLEGFGDTDSPRCGLLAPGYGHAATSTGWPSPASPSRNLVILLESPQPAPPPARLSSGPPGCFTDFPLLSCPSTQLLQDISKGLSFSVVSSKIVVDCIRRPCGHHGPRLIRVFAASALPLQPNT